MTHATIRRALSGRVLLGAAYENYGSPYDFAGRERKVYGGNVQYSPTGRTRLGFDFQWQTTRGTQAIPPIYFTSTSGYYVKDVPRSFNRAGPESTSSIIQSQASVDVTHQLTPRWVVRAGGHFRGQRQGRNQSESGPSGNGPRVWNVLKF